MLKNKRPGNTGTFRQHQTDHRYDNSVAVPLHIGPDNLQDLPVYFTIGINSVVAGFHSKTRLQGGGYRAENIAAP